MSDIQTDYATAAREYDLTFKDTLVKEISKAIAEASIVTDAPVMAIRTGETIEALTVCLIAFASLSPHFDTPSHLREFADTLAKRIRRSVAKNRANPSDDVKRIFGSFQSGTA